MLQKSIVRAKEETRHSRNAVNLANAGINSVRQNTWSCWDGVGVVARRVGDGRNDGFSAEVHVEVGDCYFRVAPHVFSLPVHEHLADETVLILR